MLLALAFRTLRSADKRCIAKFLWKFGVKGMGSVAKFKRRIKLAPCVLDRNSPNAKELEF